MADRGIAFEAGGTQFRLHLGTLGMWRFEQRTKALDPAGKGESVLVAAQQLQDGDLSMDRLVRLFWAGVEPMLPDEEAAARVMDELGFARAMEMVGQSLGDCLKGFGEGAPGKNSQSVSRSKR